MRFFYRECLGQSDFVVERMPYQRKRRVLPEILAPEEVVALFDACGHLKHRAAHDRLSGSLRISETLALAPSDVDSKRMMIRVEQGKGEKDRYVMLSATLLQALRAYWKRYRPALALRGQQTRRTALLVRGREGLQARRAQGRHYQARLLPLAPPLCTHLLEDGTNIRVIQSLLGHRCLTTTQVYTHVARTYVNDTRSPLDRMNKETAPE